jgi:ankyrin repeat protein
MATIVFISADNARTLSVSLFQAMDTLAHADAHFHLMQSAKARDSAESESTITTTLLHASQAALALCESALARVEPFYDAFHEITESASCFCRSLVTSAIAYADTVVAALEYASKNCEIATLLVSFFCSDAALRAAIDVGDLGAISLAVVLLLELPVSTSPPLCQLVHHALSLSNSNSNSNTSTKPAVIARIVRVLLLVPAIAASANETDTTGNTALMHAAFMGHTETVITLLACHTVVQCAGAIDINGDTALILASWRGHAETVAALLAHTIVVQSAGAVDADGDTALMLASWRGHTETVVALLACPMAVQSAGAVNKFGETALMLASSKGYTAIVVALLACPMVVQSAAAVDKYGENALTLASNKGYTDTVVALLACPMVVQSKENALVLASSYGHTETVTALLACPQLSLAKQHA